MQQDNSAEELDIFTGDVSDQYQPNNLFGEIHTGDAWKIARDHFCGTYKKYMPLSLVVFGD